MTGASGSSGAWGGRRRGAGRPRTRPFEAVPHLARPGHDGDEPVVVTLCSLPDVPNLRSGQQPRAITDAIAAAKGGKIRILRFAIRNNYVHLLVEASDRKQLIRGLQGLIIRLARAINRVSERRGHVWRDRYDARVYTASLGELFVG